MTEQRKRRKRMKQEVENDDNDDCRVGARSATNSQTETMDFTFDCFGEKIMHETRLLIFLFVRSFADARTPTLLVITPLESMANLSAASCTE